MKNKQKLSIAIVDQGNLFRTGLARLINSKNNYQVKYNLGCIDKFYQKISNENKQPDIIVLELMKQELACFQTILKIKKNYPKIKILVLSNFFNQQTVIDLIGIGVNGFVNKNVGFKDLMYVLNVIWTKGYFQNEIMSNALFNASISNKLVQLSYTDREFLIHCCTDFPYKKIAELMSVSPRTIDGYRDKLFKKLKVKSRVGLAVYATKSGILNLSQTFVNAAV